jgi:uncharacterized protein
MVMYDDKAPGIYIYEKAGGARPIQAVGTSTAGFLGAAPLAEAHVLRPTAITQWTQFKKEFCPAEPDSSTDLARAVYGFFQNKGSRCYVVNLGDQSLAKGLAELERIDDVAIVAAPGYTSMEHYNDLIAHCENMADRVAILDAPLTVTDIDQLKVAGTSPALPFTVPSKTPSAYLPKGVKARKKGEELLLTGIGSPGETVKVLGAGQDEIAAAQVMADKKWELIIPFPKENDCISIVHINKLKVAEPNPAAPFTVPSETPSAYLPKGVKARKKSEELLLTGTGSPGETVKVLGAGQDEIAAVQVDSDRKWELTIPFPKERDRISIVQSGEAGVKPPQSAFAAIYFPWIMVRDPLLPHDEPDSLLYTPPSGHIAGIWARSDSTRGVHKAPANEPIRGALGVERLLTDVEHGVLNQVGINCIRLFAREGILVWGARTLAPDGEWRYLNVRRLFNMIKESILQGTRWIVFEPNDETLWKAIHRDVTAFLTRIWRTGALMGSTPDQAFFVKCDAETNPPEEIDAGKVTIVIGIAPVKPAEFVIFEISQLQAGAQIAESGG